MFVCVCVCVCVCVRARARVGGWVVEGGVQIQEYTSKTLTVPKFKMVMKTAFVKLTIETPIIEAKYNAIFDVCITTHCTLLSNFRPC